MSYESNIMEAQRAPGLKRLRANPHGTPDKCGNCGHSRLSPCTCPKGKTSARSLRVAKGGRA
jgi:hypothetical protein